MVSFEIVIKILRKGLNLEKTIIVNELPHIEKIEENEYKINIDDCWENKIPPLRALRYRLMGRKHYLVVFREGQDETIKRRQGIVTPTIIDVVNNSSVLTGLFKEVFAGEGGKMKMIFFIIVALAVTVFLLNYLGIMDVVL